MDQPFVPPEFDPPRTHSWGRYHLEPLGPEHNERDHQAWMSSIDHIRSTPGFSEEEERDWPEAMSLESNMDDLVRHARDFVERSGFTYSILEGDKVVGCIYIYPDRHGDHDALISSWVTKTHAADDQPVRAELASWIESVWPFENAHFAGVEA